MADPDTTAVAELWADPKTPARLLTECPERVLEFLVSGAPWSLVLRVLANARLARMHRRAELMIDKG